MKIPLRLHLLFLFTVFLCIAILGYTQEKTVTGRVVDVSDSPLSGFIRALEDDISSKDFQKRQISTSEHL